MTALHRTHSFTSDHIRYSVIISLRMLEMCLASSAHNLNGFHRVTIELWQFTSTPTKFLIEIALKMQPLIWSHSKIPLNILAFSVLNCIFHSNTHARLIDMWSLWFVCRWIAISHSMFKLVLFAFQTGTEWNMWLEFSCLFARNLIKITNSITTHQLISHRFTWITLAFAMRFQLFQMFQNPRYASIFKKTRLREHLLTADDIRSRKMHFFLWFGFKFAFTLWINLQFRLSLR